VSTAPVESAAAASSFLAFVLFMRATQSNRRAEATPASARPAPRVARAPIAAAMSRSAREAHNEAMRALPIPFALALLATLATGCATRQVCECAVYVGGTTPMNDAEQSARGDAVSDCLKRHGGGTITGCPMPAGMPPPAPAR
jgi:hypothetical protein